MLAAVVWNYGELAPEAQVTWRTGFLLQGDTKAEQAANTNDSWKAARNPAYAPIPFTSAQMRGYYVVGPGERVDGAKYLWGWETAGYSDDGVGGGGARGAGRPRQRVAEGFAGLAEPVAARAAHDSADGGTPGAPGGRAAVGGRERAGGVPEDTGRRSRSRPERGPGS